MIKDKVMKKLLSFIGEDLLLVTLEKAIDSFQDVEELRVAKSLVARAYLSCLNLNGEYIHKAIDLFGQAEDEQGAKDCLSVAKRYKNFCALLRLLRVFRISNSELFDDLSREEWFCRYGLIWFDLYFDTDQNVAFMKSQDFEIFKTEIENIAELESFWRKLFFQMDNDVSVLPERKLILENISLGFEAVVDLQTKDVNKKADFQDWCFHNNVQVVRQLQVGRSGPSQRSDVYLVRDSDGMFKVIKEELDHHFGPLGNAYTAESELYGHIPSFEFLPRFYGVDMVGETRYLRQSFEYGSTLQNYIDFGHIFSANGANWIVSEVAQELSLLLESGLMYLDLKPANIMIVDGRIKIIDLGLSRFVKSENEQVSVCLAWPDYAAPENISLFVACQRSLVYQLGLLYCELTTGKSLSSLKIDKENREQKILGHAWYVSMGGECEKKESLPPLIRSALDLNPVNRPMIKELFELGGELHEIALASIKKNQLREKNKNTVIFPARMGIPHKGHIDFMARILELGYYLIISIQRSYTITDRDPIPKWIVMKIIAQSLFDKGYSVDDFEFRLTPLYETDQEHRMHFSMMPGMSDVVAFATGNESTYHLFPGKSVITQKDVFGKEGEVYENRSWGEIIRRAIKEDDRKTFLDYAATGTERIITQNEIKEIYGKPNIEFVSGKVVYLLKTPYGEIFGRINKYLTLEEAIVRRLNQEGKIVRIIDQYARNTIFDMDGQKMVLIYEKTVVKNGDEIIHFNLT